MAHRLLIPSAPRLHPPMMVLEGGYLISVPTTKGEPIYVRRTMSRKYGDYFQLVRSYRDEGTVKEEVLVHLGEYETPDAALATWPDEVAEPGGTAGTNRLRNWQASSTSCGHCRDRLSGS